MDEFKDNEFLKQLHPDFASSETQPDVLKFTTHASDKWGKDAIIYDWRDLIEHNDAEIRKIGEDLVNYSFYSTGFNKNIYSFHQFLPYEVLVDNGFDAHMKEALTLYNDPKSIMNTEIAESTILNNWDNDLIVPRRDDIHASYKPKGTQHPVVIKLATQHFFKQEPRYIKVVNEEISDYKDFLIYKLDGYATNEDGDGAPVYRLVPKKSYSSKGVQFREYGSSESVFEANNVETLESLFDKFKKEGKLKNTGNPQEYLNLIVDKKFKADDYKTIEEFEETVEEQSNEDIVQDVIEEREDFITPPYYKGNIKPSPNTIFVFGSNPEGRHGAGAAKVAKDKFGAIYGQGEGLQGNAYGLPTKDLRVKENKGSKSIAPIDIVLSIERLYDVARDNPNKLFKIAYRNVQEASLSGYTGVDMMDMFNAAKGTNPIPSNIIFSKEWVDSGRLRLNKLSVKQQELNFDATNDVSDKEVNKREKDCK